MIHSDGTITIDGGNVVLASGDDGVHSDFSTTVNGGNIAVASSYDGIESAMIAINGGNMHISASDDGVNASDGSGRAPADERPGPRRSNPSVDKHLSITDGYIVIDATGDGLDINGWAKMTGGTIIVNGPTVSYNGALDYAREFTMAGGTLIDVGSFGMAQGPDATSTQGSAVLSFESQQPAETLIHI